MGFIGIFFLISSVWVVSKVVDTSTNIYDKVTRNNIEKEKLAFEKDKAENNKTVEFAKLGRNTEGNPLPFVPQQQRVGAQPANPPLQGVGQGAQVGQVADVGVGAGVLEGQGAQVGDARVGQEGQGVHQVGDAQVGDAQVGQEGQGDAQVEGAGGGSVVGAGVLGGQGSRAEIPDYRDSVAEPIPRDRSFSDSSRQVSGGGAFGEHSSSRQEQRLEGRGFGEIIAAPAHQGVLGRPDSADRRLGSDVVHLSGSVHVGAGLPNDAFGLSADSSDATRMTGH